MFAYVQFIIYIFGNMLDTIGIKVIIFKLSNKDFNSVNFIIDMINMIKTSDLIGSFFFFF